MNANREIYVLGVGHNTPVTIELAQDCGFTVTGLYHYEDGRVGEIVHGIPIIGTHADLFAQPSLKGRSFALSMGNNEVRQKVFETLIAKGGSLPNLIHPLAHVSRSCHLGKGICLDSFAVLNPNTQIGDNSVISHHTVVCHNTRIGANSFIAAHGVVGAYLELGENVFIGQGAVAISEKVKTIGHHAVIGAGAVLTKSVEPLSVMAGNPARYIGSVNS